VRRPLLLAATLALLVGACAIQPDSGPRDIPANQRLSLEPVAPEAGAAAGSRRIYLVADDDEGDGGRSLRPVLRNVDPGPEAVLNELFNGPNEEEIDGGVRTDLPEPLTLHSASRVGDMLIVDVTPEILELSGPALQRAVAQIVFTASDLPGTRDVRLRVDGQQLPWPDGRGELQTDPLTIYDYPGFVPSAQPAFPAIPSEPPSP
jgi:spore germination protein GerM